MKSLKSRLFGDNKLNFHGWIVAGLTVCAGSLFEATTALLHENTLMMMFSLYLVLIGMMCLQPQSCHSRVAEKTDSPNDAD